MSATKSLKMKRRLAHGIIGLATLALAPLPAFGQVTNGSFETPAVTPGTFTSFNAGTSFAGWTVVGPNGTQVAIVSGTFTQNGFSFPAQNGVQCATAFRR